MRLRLLLLASILTLVTAAPVAAQEPTETLTIPLTSALHSFVVSPDGGRVAVFESGIFHNDLVLPEFLPIRVYDIQTSDMLAEMNGHSDYAVSLAFSPDGSRLVSLHFPGFMHVWDVETGEEIRRIDGVPGGARVQFLPDGESVAVLHVPPFQAQFLIWNIETGAATRALTQYFDSRAAFMEFVDTQRAPDAVADFDVAPDGSSIVLVFGTGKIARWDVASGDETVLRAASDDIPNFWIRHIQYDGSGERIVFSNRDEATITVMDAQSGAEIAVVPDTSIHFGVGADDDTLAWLVQDEESNFTLHISSLDDLSDVQSYDIDSSIDMSRPTGSFSSSIVAAGGRVLIGGFPSPNAPEENGILVITP